MNITNLNVCNNTGITSADLTTLTKLTNLDIGNTGITTLDLSQNTELTGLSLVQCSGLTTIDLSQNTKLQSLSAQSSGLTELELNYVHPALTSLEVGGCNSLKNLYLYQCTGLTSLNLVNDVALKDLFVPFCTNLTSMDVSYCNALENVILWDCTALTTLTGMKNTARMYIHDGLKPGIYQVGQFIHVCKAKDFSGTDAVVYEVGGDGNGNTSSEQVKIISVDESNLGWGESVATGATSTTDGKANTDKINSSSYPAAYWCTLHGTGWYLPSIDELKAIYSVKTTLNNVLSGITGATQLGTGDYWSSTEYDYLHAYVVQFYDGTYNAGCYFKSQTHAVRAVRAL